MLMDGLWEEDHVGLSIAMRRFRFPLGAALSACMILQPPDSYAQDQWLPFPPNAVFETGDTWVANGQRFRLYGVQR